MKFLLANGCDTTNRIAFVEFIAARAEVIVATDFLIFAICGDDTRGVFFFLPCDVALTALATGERWRRLPTITP